MLITNEMNRQKIDEVTSVT